MQHSNHQILPILSLLLTATLWGLVWYPLRLLEDQGLSGLWLSLISYAAAMALASVWLWRSRKDWRDNVFWLGLMTLAIGWCNVAFVLAVLDGTVVRVLLLFYLSPLWALILGWLLLDEHPGSVGLIVFVLAVAGALTMLWDPELGSPWPRDPADWLAVSSGFAFSLANVAVRKTHHLTLQTKAAAGFTGVVLVAAVWILLAAEPVPEFTPQAVTGALLLGWLGFFIMSVTVIYGVTHMPVYRSAVILLFELVIGAVSAQLLTDEIVLPREWLGGALIMGAAYLAARAHLGGES
jgi:drug/metabolite transporter (DMT)-like permease